MQTHLAHTLRPTAADLFVPGAGPVCGSQLLQNRNVAVHPAIPEVSTDSQCISYGPNNSYFLVTQFAAKEAESNGGLTAPSHLQALLGSGCLLLATLHQPAQPLLCSVS